jgi:hypothetical protein
MTGGIVGVEDMMRGQYELELLPLLNPGGGGDITEENKPPLVTVVVVPEDERHFAVEPTSLSVRGGDARRNGMTTEVLQ